VASALHYDAGLLVDQAVARARETFRPGETVRAWCDRAAAAEDALLTLTVVALLLTTLRAKRRWSATRVGVIGALCLAIVGLLFAWKGWWLFF
jgi:hypothetical protein